MTLMLVLALTVVGVSNSRSGVRTESSSGTLLLPVLSLSSTGEWGLFVFKAVLGDDWWEPTSLGRCVGDCFKMSSLTPGREMDLFMNDLEMSCWTYTYITRDDNEFHALQHLKNNEMSERTSCLLSRWVSLICFSNSFLCSMTKVRSNVYAEISSSGWWI